MWVPPAATQKGTNMKTKIVLKLIICYLLIHAPFFYMSIMNFIKLPKKWSCQNRTSWTGSYAYEQCVWVGGTCQVDDVTNPPPLFLLIVPCAAMSENHFSCGFAHVGSIKSINSTSKPINRYSAALGENIYHSDSYIHLTKLPHPEWWLQKIHTAFNWDCRSL